MPSSLDAASLGRVEALFKALANPIRLSILQLLGTSPYCVRELVALVDAPQPLISQHLRILRAARLVEATRRGKEMVYTLHDAHVSQIVDDAIRHSLERDQHD
jgi:DNA-binding transcriptional ArsR family regulator